MPETQRGVRIYGNQCSAQNGDRRYLLVTLATFWLHQCWGTWWLQKNGCRRVKLHSWPGPWLLCFSFECKLTALSHVTCSSQTPLISYDNSPHPETFQQHGLAFVSQSWPLVGVQLLLGEFKVDLRTQFCEAMEKLCVLHPSYTGGWRCLNPLFLSEWPVTLTYSNSLLSCFLNLWLITLDALYSPVENAKLLQFHWWSFCLAK